MLYDPDKKSMRVLTRSEEDTVSSEPFPAGDPPDMIAMAMEKGAFESACALPSGVVRGCEPTSMLKRVTAYTNNPAQWPDAQAQWKLKPPSR